MHFSTGFLLTGLVLAFASLTSATPFRVAFAGDPTYQSLKTSSDKPGKHCPPAPAEVPYGVYNTNKKIYWNDYGNKSQGTTACGQPTGPAYATGNYVALDQKYTDIICGQKVVVVFEKEAKFVEAEVIDLSDFDENLPEGGCDGVVLAKQTFALIGDLNTGVYDGNWIISLPYEGDGFQR